MASAVFEGKKVKKIAVTLHQKVDEESDYTYDVTGLYLTRIIRRINEFRPTGQLLLIHKVEFDARLILSASFPCSRTLFFICRMGLDR